MKHVDRFAVIFATPIGFLFWASFLFFGCASTSDEQKASTANLHVKIGLAYIKAEVYPKAIEAFQKAIETQPQLAVAHGNLGVAFHLSGQFDLSERSLRKTVALDPKATDFRVSLARVLIDRGEYSEAIHQARLCLEDLTYIWPQKAWFIVALAQFKQKKFSLARGTLEKTLKLQNKSCLIQSLYGRTLLALDELMLAHTALTQAVTLCDLSKYEEPRYYKALVSIRLNQKETAKTQLEELLKRYPEGNYKDRAKDMLGVLVQ